MTLRLPNGHFFGRTLVERSTPHLNLVLTSYGRGRRLPVHAHEKPYLAVVLCGQFDERSSGAEHACAEGTLVWNTVGAEHSDSFGAERTEVLNVELGPEWISALGDEGWIGSAPAWIDGRARLSRIQSLRAQLARPDALSPFVVEGLCAELIGHASRAHAAPRRRASAVWLESIEDVLRERFREPPDLLTLGQLAGVGPSSLARAFRARHGCSIGTFVRRLRVEHAREAIARTRDPLASVALESGYADQSHMTREFRRLLGCTPGELRAD